MYADFTDYQGAYCGTLITTQGQWMPAVREACAYLDEEGRCSIHPYLWPPEVRGAGG